MQDLRAQIGGRPLILAFAGLIAGLAGRAFPITVLAFLILLLVVWAVRPALLGAVFFIAGAFLSPAIPDSIQPGSLVSGTAAVITAPDTVRGGKTFTLSLNGQKLRAFWAGSPHVSLGDELTVNAKSLAIKDSPELAKVRGIAGEVHLNDQNCQRASSGSRTIAAASAFADQLREFTASQIGGDEGALVDALAFSDSSHLSDPLKRELEETGTIFLIAASGLHVFILETILMAITCHSLVPKFLRILILGTFLAFYAFATGMHPAVVRASIMAFLAGSAYLWRKEYDGISALCFAGILYLLWQPSQLFQPGFQMSMLAVGVLAAGSPLVSDVKWKQDLASSFWGWLGSTPIGAFWFGVASWAGIIAPFVPLLLIGPLIILCAAGYAVHGIGASLSVPFIVGARAGADLILSWLSLFQRIPFRFSEIGAFSGYYLAVLYAVLFWQLLRLTPRRSA